MKGGEGSACEDGGCEGVWGCEGGCEDGGYV